MFFKIGVFKDFAKFTGKPLHWDLFLSKVWNSIIKEALAQVFSYEFCKIFKNMLLMLWATAYIKLNCYPCPKTPYNVLMEKSYMHQ